MYLETSTGPGSSEVWSPDLDISGMSNPELSFEYHMYGATMGTMAVSIVADTLNTVIVIPASSKLRAPIHGSSVDLSPYLICRIEIRFSGNRNGSFTGDMAVDNFSIDEAPLCAPVTNLSASNITGSSAIELEFCRSRCYFMGSRVRTCWIRSRYRYHRLSC